MNVASTLFCNTKCWRFLNTTYTRCYAARTKNPISPSNKFETVFSFPTVKYIALINRLKVYHFLGSSVAIPSCGLLEILDLIPSHSCLAASYIGLTGVAVLSFATLPFTNVIGHLYVSEDNEQVKISYVDFWGKRRDRVVTTENWVPLLEMKPRTMDAVYLSPQLSDGTKYKLFIKFGKVLNATKIGQVLE